MACADRGLVINITEAGAEEPAWLAAACPVRADLADIRTRRLFEAAPGEFFRMYGRGAAVENFHAAPGVPESALGYLSMNPDGLLTMTGHLSVRRLASLRADASRCGIPLAVRRTGSPRAVTAESSTGSFSSLDDLSSFRMAGGDGCNPLFTAGIRNGDVPAACWSSWFRVFFAMEIVPALRPRSESLLYSFMKILAAGDAAPVNWSAAGSLCGISGACARDWTHGLEELGLLDLVDPLPAPPPRRAKKRPKLFFNQPGLALWLNNPAGGTAGAGRRAAGRSAVRLALKDAFPDARFSHFLDTNGIEAPLVIETQADGRRAVYFPLTPEEAALAERHLASLARAGIVRPEGLAVTVNDPGAHPCGMLKRLRPVPLLSRAGSPPNERAQAPAKTPGSGKPA